MQLGFPAKTHQKSIGRGKSIVQFEMIMRVGLRVTGQVKDAFSFHSNLVNGILAYARDN